VGAIVEIGFAQGQWKLDGSRKMNYPGTIDRGFTVSHIRRGAFAESDIKLKREFEEHFP
jgi:hypothetical protein